MSQTGTIWQLLVTHDRLTVAEAIQLADLSRDAVRCALRTLCRRGFAVQTGDSFARIEGVEYQDRRSGYDFKPLERALGDLPLPVGVRVHVHRISIAEAD